MSNTQEHFDMAVVARRIKRSLETHQIDQALIMNDANTLADLAIKMLTEKEEEENEIIKEGS